MTDSYLAIELTLMESRGLLPRVGQQTMVCRFCSHYLPGTTLSDANVSVLAPDRASNTWREHQRDVTVEEAHILAGMLAQLGLPARTPHVSPVMDTSDGWTNLMLRVRVNDRDAAVDLRMQTCGFEGDDAESLRRMLRFLFSLAGYEGYDPGTYGEQPPPAIQAPANPVSSLAEAKRCSHCGHEVGAGAYSHDVQGLCSNGSCRQPLMLLSATCRSAGCGHMAPVAANFCWVCGCRVHGA